MEKWTLEIKPVSGWFDINIKDIWHYRDLIRLFFRRDFVVFYKQTILGPLWFIIQPLFTTIVFTIVFGNIAKLPTDGLPIFLFYMSGNVLWAFFSECVNKTANTFISNAGLFGKVYFPRILVSISSVLFGLFTFSIQFLLFFGFWLYFYFSGSSIEISIYALLFPALLLQLILLGLGVGMVVSSLTTKYRDLTFVVSFGVNLWMYASPVVYSLNLVPSEYRWLVILNPMTMIIETFRLAFLGQGYFSIESYFISLIISVLLFSFGIILFSRVEKSFIDKI